MIIQKGYRILECILQRKIAYAIMPIGKNEVRYSKQYDNKKPQCASTGAFLFPILVMAGFRAIG